MLDNTYFIPSAVPGLYIHIPFCSSKCLYCDFYSAGATIADWSMLVDSLVNELIIRRNELTGLPDSLYMGGGTPSIMPCEAFARLAKNCRFLFNPILQWNEFTIEVNPDDVTEEKCNAWLNAGVNRISMGIQSLNPDELKIIGRRHKPETAINAFNLLNKYFSNISVDLIFGLPQQTMQSLNNTLEKILSLGPKHISVYCLMLEEGTALELLWRKKRIELPSENILIEMWESINLKLAERGFKHYEISNYSLPGYESIHNSKYWDGSQYLGIGPSAHSYDGFHIRRANPKDLKNYLKHFANINTSFPETQNHFYTEERLSDDELREEMIFTRLRTSRGLEISEFASLFGENSTQLLLKKCCSFKKNGLLEIKDDRIFLNEKGFILSDSIFTELF